MQFSKESVRAYFNSTLPVYSKWSRDHVHYGFWNETTENLEEASNNTAEYVAKCLNIQAGDIVLDAGCGVGGTSRHIVSNYGVETIGINISDGQIKKAKLLSRDIKNRSLLDFQTQDYTQTTFPDEFFTKAFALESICYAPNKEKFLREAYRLLKKTGKLLVADAFQIKFDLSNREKKLYRDFLMGWAMAEFAGKRSFEEKLREVGFRNILYYDKTNAIAQTSMIVHKTARKWYPFTFLLSKLKLIPKEWHNTMIAGINQKILCFDSNIIRYGIFVAEK